MSRCSQSNRGSEGECDGPSGHLNPDCHGIIANLLGGETLGVGHGCWNGHWYCGAAGVASGGDAEAGDHLAGGVVCPRKVGFARIAGHTLSEGGRDLEDVRGVKYGYGV
jgi:hypothetical protein